MISQYETGLRKPKQDTIQNIANALGIPWYELYADSTEERIKAIKEEIDTELRSAIKRDSEFVTLFKHPVIQDFADQIIQLEEQRTLLSLVQLKHVMPESQDAPKYMPPDEQEKNRRIRNCIAYTLLDHGIKPSGYRELISLGFPDGDATYLLNYDMDSVPGRGIKTEAQIKEWQDIIDFLNATPRSKEE